jgi:hypothetical protein
MTPIFNKLFAVSIIFCLTVACKKDEIKTVMKTGVPPALTLSNPAVVLTAATGQDTVQSISWTASDYGFNAAVGYTLQIARAGTNFANPLQVSMGNRRLQKYTGAELNQIALIRGLPPGNLGQLEVRIKSSLTDSLAIYSDKVTLTVTPYLVIINYPSLWVPGDYNGWNAATAPKISSKLSNGVYEGYVDITPSALTFKYTSHPDWTHTSYGWASSTVSGDNVSGTFNTTGGNLFVPVAGYYLLKGNTNDNTWSGTKINVWSLSGDLNAWGDTDMSFNTTTKLWTITVNVAAAGVLKFRANHSWDINFGDTGADLLLDYNGANIPVTAGARTITLDLSVPGNYTYKIQ